MQHPCTLVEGLTYDESHTVLTQTLPNQQDCFTISSCSHRLVGPRTSKVSCIPGSGRLFDIVLVTNKKIRIILSFSTTCSREPIYPVSLAPNQLHATGGLITKGSYSNRSAGFITLFGERPWLRPYITYEHPVSGGPDNP